MTRIIMDNGGGITLQLGGYAHHYDDAAQAAEDYNVYLRDGNTDDWDGHDEDALALNPTYDEVRNGGYIVHDADSIAQAVADEDFDSGWNNLDDFISTLKS